MVQFTSIISSLAIALVFSFGLYDQRDLSGESYAGREVYDLSQQGYGAAIKKRAGTRYDPYVERAPFYEQPEEPSKCYN